MEKYGKFPSRTRVSHERASAIESIANYEGNAAVATIDRARNPIIQQQMVEMFHRAETLRRERLQDEEWERYIPEGWTGDEKFTLLKGKRFGSIIDANELTTELQSPIRTREEIVKALQEEIEHVAGVTEIEFSAEEPTVDRMTTEWKMPLTGEKLTTKQMSIVEAHEKGHRLRAYDDVVLKPLFMPAFDPSKVVFTQADYKIQEDSWRQNETEVPPPPHEELKQIYLNDYLFTPRELSERMSQLKNYFGMTGSEVFTQEHLRYAREHYIADTGLDNAMRFFFDAITPETEGKFIELINSAGI